MKWCKQVYGDEAFWRCFFHGCLSRESWKLSVWDSLASPPPYEHLPRPRHARYCAKVSNECGSQVTTDGGLRGGPARLLSPLCRRGSSLPVFPETRQPRRVLLYPLLQSWLLVEHHWPSLDEFNGLTSNLGKSLSLAWCGNTGMQCCEESINRRIFPSKD